MSHGSLPDAVVQWYPDSRGPNSHPCTCFAWCLGTLTLEDKGHLGRPPSHRMTANLSQDLLLCLTSLLDIGPMPSAAVGRCLWHWELKQCPLTPTSHNAPGPQVSSLSLLSTETSVSMISLSPEGSYPSHLFNKIQAARADAGPQGQEPRPLLSP